MRSGRLKHLVEDVDRHGNVRLYVRVPGRPKVRLREKLWTPKFWAAYQAAVAGDPLPSARRKGAAVARSEGRSGRVVAESLRALCVDYYASPEFKRLGANTRAVRRALLESICQFTFRSGKPPWGEGPYRMMEARHVRRLRDAWAAPGPKGGYDAANGRLKALRQLFAWALEAGLADRNPARDVKYLKGKPGGFHTWTVEEVRRFEARHPIGSKARLALALLLFTGVRRSDVVRLGRQMIGRDGWLHFTEAKGASRQVKDRALPVLPELRAVLEATPSGHMTFLVTAFGKPFTAAGFGNWLRDRCDEAGLRHCSAHGLRKAGATIAADNGATEHQLMAIFGWDSPKQAATYTRHANRKRLAGDAMHLLIAREQSGNISVPPGQGVTENWDKSAEKPKEIKDHREGVAPRAGLEPATQRLTAACSTN
jgi:integrase